MGKYIPLKELARRSLEESGFLVGFSKEIDREVLLISAQNEFVMNSSVKDLSHLPWSSIDNIDSMDLDQLEYVERINGLGYRVYVAIADVDSQLALGSAMDARATQNTTSIYLGIEIVTMIPELLCYNRTSLLEGKKRNAIVVEFDVALDGSVKQSHIYLALVCNQGKFSYDEVALLLEKGEISPALKQHSKLVTQLHLQDEVAQVLRKKRTESGALELETIEARPVINRGQVVSLEVTPKNRARELIEDLMIAANTCCALFLTEHKISSLRRVVRVPKRWSRIVALALELGYELPKEASSLALAHVMRDVRTKYPERFPDLSLSVVKLMGNGEYVLETSSSQAEGHFGLAVEDYAHSTAPNRRFADLITQRLLKSCLLGYKVPYSDTDLSFLANQCTQRSDAAQKVERFVRKAIAAQFLSNRIGDVFDGIITGASDKGIYARLFRFPAEGRVVFGGRGLDVGQKVKLKLVATLPPLGHIDFAVHDAAD